MSKPLVIIAGYGYIGQQVGEEFRAKNWEVIGLSRSDSQNTRACDISDKDEVSLLRKEFPHAGHIVHCASKARGGGIEAYEKVYRDGCKNLCEAFPAATILYTSSTSVYGQSDGQEVTEESETIPVAKTGNVLLEAENIILQNNGIVARLAGIYGPGRSVLLKKFFNDEAIIEDGGQRHFNQIHRDDAATAIVHLLLQQGTNAHIYNICDSTPLKQIDCYQTLAKKYNRPLPPSGPRDLNKKRGWTNKKVSNTKLLNTGWKPTFPSFLDATDHILPTLNPSIP